MGHLCRLVRLSIQAVCNGIDRRHVTLDGFSDQGISDMRQHCPIALGALDRHREGVLEHLVGLWPSTWIAGLAFCECHLFSVLKKLIAL